MPHLQPVCSATLAWLPFASTLLDDIRDPESMELKKVYHLENTVPDTLVNSISPHYDLTVGHNFNRFIG